MIEGSPAAVNGLVGADADGAAKTDVSAENSQPREKRSRDRYGRERGPRSDRSDRGEQRDQRPRDGQQPLDGFAPDNAAPNAGEVTSGGDVPAAEPVAHRSYFAERAAAQSEQVQPKVTDMAVVAPEPVREVQRVEAPATQPAQVSVPIAPAAASTPESRSLPTVQAFSLPVVDLVQVALGSGLSWVNSDPTKVAAVQAAISAEAKPIHVPRARPPAVQIDAGPLVLVETKRDLAKTKLPFEETSPQELTAQ